MLACLLACWFAYLLIDWLVGWLWLVWIRSNDATNKMFFSFNFILNAFTVERLMLCVWVCVWNCVASQCDAILARFELWICSFNFVLITIILTFFCCILHEIYILNVWVCVRIYLFLPSVHLWKRYLACQRQRICVKFQQERKKSIIIIENLNGYYTSNHPRNTEFLPNESNRMAEKWTLFRSICKNKLLFRHDTKWNENREQNLRIFCGVFVLLLWWKKMFVWCF